MLHRISLLAAVVMAALAISVTPALAGEDDGTPPPPPVTTVPAPVPPPAPVPAPTPPQPAPKKAPEKAPKAEHSGGSKSSGSKSNQHTTRSFTPVAQQTFTIPQGGVQAGAGGTAPQDSDSMLPIGLGLIGLMLGAAGALTLRRRYVTE